MKSFRRKIREAINNIILSLDYLIILSAVFSSTKPNSLLIVRLDAIGDFVIWLDTAKEYRRIFPDKKITLIANVVWADLAKSLPYWDVVWAVDIHHLGWLKLLRRWQLLRQIRKEGFHTAIQPTCSRVLMEGDSIVRATQAPHRIGSEGDLSNCSVTERKISNRWYTKLLAKSPQPMMELLRNAEFFSQLAETPYQAHLPQLPILTTLPVNLRPSAPYFIVFPGSMQFYKRWAVKNFVEVLKHIHGSYGWQPVLCGSTSEIARCQAIVDATESNCINLAGKTNLLELAEIIRGASLLVGNDTSAVHIAVAVATPAVCILGGGHFGRFMPYPNTIPGLKPVAVTHQMNCYQCNWVCSQPSEADRSVPCINNISVASVTEAVQQVLN